MKCRSHFLLPTTFVSVNPRWTLTPISQLTGPTINNDLSTWFHRTTQSINAGGGPSVPPLPITQGIGNFGNFGNFDHSISVFVSRYEPSPGDKYGPAYHWTDITGNLRSMELPPYFISRLDLAREEMERLFREIRETYIQHFIGDGDQVAIKTFQLALVFATIKQVRRLTMLLILLSQLCHLVSP